MNKLIFCFFLFFSFYFLIPSSQAQSFSSTDYRIQWGNFNMTAGSKTNANYRLTDTVGQNAPGQYSRSGYYLKSGFQYIHDLIYAFSFKIDHLEVEFGTLTLGVANTATDTLTVTSPTGHGYQVFVAENHPLTQNAGITLPDTNCNTGCSESSPGIWTSTSSYGFGLNATGINNSGVDTGVGTTDYFLTPNHFRQFADLSANESAQVIMSHPLATREQIARVTYKTVASSVQAAGVYHNSIIYTAVPNY